MKKLLFILFLAGCAAQASGPIDAGINTQADTLGSVHFEHQYKYTYGKYYPMCLRHCGAGDCIDKCDKDFKQIKKVLERAIRDHREDDFYEMMDSWYEQD